MRMRWAALAMLATTSALAQSAGSSPQAVADASTFGAVAAQSSLCGLRDESWVEDLRRATQDLPADQDHLSAAMGYGDMEATEDFATDSPEVVCRALSANPALARADRMVAAFRARMNHKPVS